MIGVAFTLLLVLTIPLLIVFFAPRLKKSYKRQKAERSLTFKHYPGVITIMTLSSSALIIFGGLLLTSIYGETGTFVALGLALMLTLALVKTIKTITEKAKQREAEGHDIESNIKLIKQHYPQAYGLLVGLIPSICTFIGTFILLMYDWAIGIVFWSILLLVSLPYEYWMRNKLFEKAKLQEGGLK